MLENPDFEQDNCSRTAEGIYKIEHDSIRLMKWLIYYDRSITFRNIDNFEANIDAIDQDYVSEEGFFKGYIYKINTLQFNLVNGIQYGNCCDFKREIFENRGDNTFIPTKGYCFIKCVIF